MNLSKMQQASALVSLCHVDGEDCPAHDVLRTSCPFNTVDCKSVSERDWKAVLDSAPDDQWPMSSEYGVKVEVSLTIHKSIKALSARAARNRAEADTLAVLKEAGMAENAKVTVEDYDMEDK